MMVNDEILKLFTRLREEGSLDSAINESIQTACLLTQSHGVVLHNNSESFHDAEIWGRYDPDCLLEQGHHHQVRVPLHLGEQVVGSLTLLAPAKSDSVDFQECIKPLDTVLATLMVAATSALNTVDGLLSGPAFRTRLDSEVARARRYENELSILQLQVKPTQHVTQNDGPNDQFRTTQIGKSLVSLLRETDVVGLLAPDRLAVLLPATSGLAAKIAQRRIEKLLPDFYSQVSTSSDFDIRLETFSDGNSNFGDICGDFLQLNAVCFANSSQVTT